MQERFIQCENVLVNAKIVLSNVKRCYYNGRNVLYNPTNVIFNKKTGQEKLSSREKKVYYWVLITLKCNGISIALDNNTKNIKAKVYPGFSKGGGKEQPP